KKSRRSLSESGPVESSKPLPHKRESLESLYFTPIPTRSRSKLENSVDSIGNITLDSGRKALSGRRRTTQLINITMIKKHPKLEPLDSTNESFVSLRSSGSGESDQESVKTRLRSAAVASSSSSTRSLASLPSQESLIQLAASSPDGASGHAALKSLPGYRPATRSSLRHSQGGGGNPGRSSFYAASCDDEPEQLDGWNRIAELQQRNRICPPHLKTCYPLESRVSLSCLARFLPLGPGPFGGGRGVSSPPARGALVSGGGPLIRVWTEGGGRFPPIGRPPPSSFTPRFSLVTTPSLRKSANISIHPPPHPHASGCR
ncbi:nuclear mitotic apparatus protein 1-like, partial [Pseudonaja textilis]|uniref:nuclear mitotic apparatus protein 1-like n=1 Tax=Pseudonaja textilis TaxID=8673 RepID=UPI000EA8693E